MEHSDDVPTWEEDPLSSLEHEGPPVDQELIILYFDHALDGEEERTIGTLVHHVRAWREAYDALMGAPPPTEDGPRVEWDMVNRFVRSEATRDEEIEVRRCQRWFRNWFFAIEQAYAETDTDSSPQDYSSSDLSE